MQGLGSSSGWVLGGWRKQSTTQPAALECLFFQQSVMPVCRAALPGGRGPRAFPWRNWTPSQKGRAGGGQHISRSPGAALGGPDLVLGALEVLLEVKGMQPWIQHKEVVSHTTMSTEGERGSDYSALPWTVCRQKLDGQG